MCREGFYLCRFAIEEMDLMILVCMAHTANTVEPI